MQRYIRFGVNKMVRDLVIPQCQQQGCRVAFVVMPPARQLTESAAKITEEAAEVAAAPTLKEAIRELADLADAMEKFMAVRGITPDELSAARRDKKARKGAFEDDLYLTAMDVPLEHKDLPNFLADPAKYINLGEVTEADPPPPNA